MRALLNPYETSGSTRRSTRTSRWPRDLNQPFKQYRILCREKADQSSNMLIQLHNAESPITREYIFKFLYI